MLTKRKASILCIIHQEDFLKREVKIYYSIQEIAFATPYQERRYVMLPWLSHLIAKPLYDNISYFNVLDNVCRFRDITRIIRGHFSGACCKRHFIINLIPSQAYLHTSLSTYCKLFMMVLAHGASFQWYMSGGSPIRFFNPVISCNPVIQILPPVMLSIPSLAPIFLIIPNPEFSNMGNFGSRKPFGGLVSGTTRPGIRFQSSKL